jgi:hypothetical protein
MSEGIQQGFAIWLTGLPTPKADSESDLFL